MENTQTCQLMGKSRLEEVWAALMVTNKNLKEATGKIRETEQKMRKIIGDLERKSSEMGRKIDDMFVRCLERRFGAMGFAFDRSAERALFGNREFPSCYAAVDVFLENGERGLAVTVKPQPYIVGKYGEDAAGSLAEANIDDIWEHVERMEKLRRCFDLNNDGRKLYGAVAATVFPANVLGCALEQGFYVIECAAERVDVKEPEGEAREW